MCTLAGIFPPIPTPFDRGGELALKELARNIEAWNRTSLTGYVVLGSNGEAVLLSGPEKRSLLTAAREAIPEDRAMIAGTGCQSTRETIALTKEAGRIGADFALVLTPHYYRAQMSEEALVCHFTAVADSSPIPILIYNIPASTGIDITADVVARLAEHENIVGMKDSSGNLVKFAEIRRATPASFRLLVGSASFLLPGLALGASGGVLALANIAPDETVELFSLWQEGEVNAAREIQLRLLAANAAVTRRFGIPALKAALDMIGMYGGPVRPPLVPLDEDGRGRLRAILNEAGLLKEEG